MLSFLFFALLFITGHSLGALVVYLNHRFVLHGRLRRWPLLKKLARLHGLHHAHHNDKNDPYIFMPLWGKLSLVFILVIIATLSLPLSLGISSFCLLYMYRHWAIHNTDTTSRFFRHHNLHHKKFPNKNFSGIYPVIDKIFNTNEPS